GKLTVMRKVLLAALIVVSACAPKVVPAPVVTSPRFPEFIKPLVPEALIATPAAVYQSRGWAFLQSGDVRTAEHEFSTALKLAPTFYPAETSLGYVGGARRARKRSGPSSRGGGGGARGRWAFGRWAGRGVPLPGPPRDPAGVPPSPPAAAPDPSPTVRGARIEVSNSQRAGGELP